MFARWLAKREQKRIKAQCPHEWHKVRDYRGEHYNGYDIDFYDAATLYCPMCRTIRDGVNSAEAEKVLRIQEIRKEYEEGGR